MVLKIALPDDTGLTVSSSGEASSRYRRNRALSALPGGLERHVGSIGIGSPFFAKPCICPSITARELADHQDDANGAFD
ncbi:hypothetical protein PPH41_15190 [Burkholderia gladioli]|nr:hypothetical protein [Burkholderia gladioli]